jgi:hypothetical protein
MKAYILLLAWVCAVISSSGCDSGPEMGRVNGVMLFGGTPVAEGTVQFYPVKPGPMAAGRIGEAGKFSLVTKEPGDGALVGEHVVVVIPPNDAARLEQEVKPGKRMISKFEDIPQSVRSQATSKVVVEVKPGANDFTLDLKELAD